MSDSHQPPLPHPELRRLEPLIGSWTARDTSVEGPGGPAMLVDLQESYRWLEGGYFLESRYTVRFGDAPLSYGVMYWLYDEQAERFRTVYFNDQGPFHERDSRYTGVVEDGGLVFTGPARFRFPLDGDGRIAVGDDGTVRSEWWLRDDAGQWAPWRHATYRRVG
jgi:hypothetical protein